MPARIGLDRPIPTNEKTLETQETTETESIQKTDTAGKVALDVEQQVVKEPVPTTESKGQQLESRLGGLARQTELQSKLPASSAPMLNNLRDKITPLERNILPDEKIDVTKNLPNGHTIDRGLGGLDWGPNKAKTGPNHMSVDMTTGGMKAPNDVIADVLNGGKPAQPAAPPSPNSGGMKKTDGTSGGNSGFAPAKEGGGSNSAPPPGVGLSSSAPKWDLISGKELPQYEPPKKEEPKEKPWYEKVVDTVKDTVNDAFGKSKSMTDPDAGGGTGGGGGVPSADDLARAKARLGQAEHSVNPDLGLGGGAVAPEKMKRPIDLLRDPTDDGESSVKTGSPEDAKLAADIHGPRTVNPDLGIDPQPIVGGDKGGPDPNVGNFS